MNAEIQAVLSGESRYAIVQGDCLDVLASLPADAANLCFGSPPYAAARLYLEDGVNLGIARDAETWAAWMVHVFGGCLRVCPGLTAMVVEGQTNDFRYDAAPFLLAADLHRAGINLRKPAVYRRSGIPGSGGPDWLRNEWETIICATRGGKLPWTDSTACGHPPKFAPGGACTHRGVDGTRANGRDQWRVTASPRKPNGEREEQSYSVPVKANPGNVIDCRVGGGLMGSNLAHENEAPFPESLPDFFVLSFCPPGGIVLDPFAGSGTTIASAVKNGRRAIGIDLRASQVALAKRRLSGVTPTMFAE